MIKPRYSKILGAFLGTLTIIAALGFGLLFLIGMGLQQTLSTEIGHASNGQTILLNLIILVMLIISGFITAIAPFTLKKRLGKLSLLDTVLSSDSLLSLSFLFR